LELQESTIAFTECIHPSPSLRAPTSERYARRSTPRNRRESLYFCSSAFLAAFSRFSASWKFFMRQSSPLPTTVGAPASMALCAPAAPSSASHFAKLMSVALLRSTDCPAPATVQGRLAEEASWGKPRRDVTDRFGGLTLPCKRRSPFSGRHGPIPTISNCTVHAPWTGSPCR
jgi:hypothetical protein